MRFVSEQEKNRKNDRMNIPLLHFSNYLYNNMHAAIKSPHYEEIIDKINSIEPSFLDVANKFRGITASSPALSQFTNEIKLELMSIVEEHYEEIFADGLVEQKPSTYDYEDYERDFTAEEHGRPLSQADFKELESLSNEGSTEGESSFSSEELDELFSAGFSIENEEFRGNAVELLIKYLQVCKKNPSEHHTDEYRSILRSVKTTCPNVISKLNKTTPNLLQSEVQQLFNIAQSNKETLYTFQEEMESDNRKGLTK